jgi:alpha-beta hydrolase superfamily lysophospholipase
MKKKTKKILRWIVIGMLPIALSACVTVPLVVMNSMTNMRVNFNRVFTAEEFGLTANHFFTKTEDGINISAWEVEVENPKAVVICISGIHNPSATIYFGHARLFKEHNFATIMFDMRARGESGGNRITVGYKEWLDVKAIVNYIKEKPLYENVPIIVLGLSQGGATAVNATGKIVDIDGLITLSAFSSWERVFYDGMVSSIPKFVAVFYRPFIPLVSFLKFGTNSCTIKPRRQIKNLGGRPALIMHSTGDSQIPFRHFERLVSRAPSHVETLVRDGDFHFIIENFALPETDKEYSEKLIQFITNLTRQ